MFLKTLTLSYCPMGGSSRGMVKFIQTTLGPFAEANPNLTIKTVLGRGKHPVLRAEYDAGYPKVLDAKNQDPKAILGMCQVLRQSSGRKMREFDKPLISQRPSLQGTLLAALRDESRGPEPGPDRVRRQFRPSEEKALDSKRSKEAIKTIWPELPLKDAAA